jgi:hypothetical protein
MTTKTRSKLRDQTALSSRIEGEAKGPQQQPQTLTDIIKGVEGRSAPRPQSQTEHRWPEPRGPPPVIQFPGLPTVNLVRDLSREELWVLKQWGLPTSRPILDRDLKQARVIRDPGHRKRLENHGLSVGHWHGGKRFWYPIEIAYFLLTLREEPPPAMVERSVKGLEQARGVARPLVTVENSQAPESPTSTPSPASSKRRQRRAETAVA